MLPPLPHPSGALALLTSPSRLFAVRSSSLVLRGSCQFQAVRHAFKFTTVSKKAMTNLAWNTSRRVNRMRDLRKLKRLR